MRLIDVDGLGVGRCSKDVLPAAYCAGWNGLLGLIEKAPTVDAVPVVRCKDCKYYRVGVLLAPNKFCFRLKHPVEDRPIGYNFAPDDFCSHGERKDGDSDG